MVIEHPFQSLFASFDHPPGTAAPAVNRAAYEALCEVLDVAPQHAGRGILLRAPAPGHGKTHLLSRIRQHFGPSHEFLPLQAAGGTRIDAVSVTDDTLRWLTRLGPAAGGACRLDRVVRRLFSLALEPLVRSGEVPCLDREATLVSLCERPLETFDFHHPAALSAHWTRDNFGVLGPRLSLELAQLTACPPRPVGFWVEAMFRFAVTPTDHPGRVDALFQTALNGCSGEGAALERLAGLLALIGLLTRVVLVADDVDGFSADAHAALRMAWFLAALRQSADRLEVIVALNRDVWDRAFIPCLSGALAERLTEVIVELEPLTHAEQVALLESRVPGMGARMLRSLGPEPDDRCARSLLRAAGAAWLKVARELTTPAEGEPPVTLQPPLAMVNPSAQAEVKAPVATGGTPPVTVPPPPVHSPVPPPVPPVEPPPPPIIRPSEPQPARHPEAASTVRLALSDGKSGFQPVVEDSASRPSANETTGWMPDVHGREDACPPTELPVLPESAPAVEPPPPLHAVERPLIRRSPEPSAANALEQEATAPTPPQPVPAAAEQAAAPAAVDSERVDSLLRQFRERYGRQNHE